jgi:hypothetical protein
MKNNVKRTFRPTLEVLEGRLVPSSYTVNTTADPAPGSPGWVAYTADGCSLRWAIDNLRANGAANGPNNINITATGTITLASPLGTINKPVVITGPGNTGANTLTVRGDRRGAVFAVANVNASISGMVITNGDRGIVNLGNLILSNVTVTGNTTEGDGGESKAAERCR